MYDQPVRFVFLVGVCATASGCSALFGLEAPTHGDASVDDSPGEGPSDAARDAAPDSVPPTPDAAPDASPASAQCPASYSAVNGSASKYRLVTNQAEWATAEANCQADSTSSMVHTHLIVLDSDTERTGLAAFAGGDSWVGLSDRVTENTYVWVTDQVTSYPPATTPPWASGEPAVSDNEDCILLQGGGAITNATLTARSCTITKRYVCECDAYAADPTHF